MKFLVDAQLPPALCKVLSEFGHNSIHTDNLKNSDRSSDREIRNKADAEERILISKDYDFYHSHMTLHKPKKLLLITAGNLKNRQPFQLIRNNMKVIARQFKECALAEISNDQVIGI